MREELMKKIVERLEDLDPESVRPLVPRLADSLIEEFGSVEDALLWLEYLDRWPNISKEEFEGFQQRARGEKVLRAMSSFVDFIDLGATS